MPRSRLFLLAVSAWLFASSASAQSLNLVSEELLTESSPYSTNQRPRVEFTSDGAKHIVWVGGSTFEEEGVFAMSASLKWNRNNFKVRSRSLRKFKLNCFPVYCLL